MNKNVKLLFNAFFYGTMIGSMFVWIYTIGVAKRNNWVIVMDFNMYGEGMLEYIYMFVWLAVAVFKLIEYLQKTQMIKSPSDNVEIEEKKEIMDNKDGNTNR